MENLDGQVLPDLSENVLRFLLYDLSRAVVRVYDVIADLVDELLAATDAELETVEGVGEIRAKDIREGLRRLQEINLVDRYLQT